MHILGMRKRKRALKDYGHQAKEIHDLYFARKVFDDKIRGKEKPKLYYVYKVKEICEQFKISTSYLHFLVLHHAGEEVKYCEFCGHTIKKIRFRLSKYDFVDECGHTGICTQCEKPCQIDKQGFCFRCNPKDEPIEEMNHLNTDINFIMGYCLSQNSFSHIQNRDTLKALRVYAMEIVSHLEYLINP